MRLCKCSICFTHRTKIKKITKPNKFSTLIKSVTCNPHEPKFQQIGSDRLRCCVRFFLLLYISFRLLLMNIGIELMTCSPVSLSPSLCLCASILNAWLVLLYLVFCFYCRFDTGNRVLVQVRQEINFRHRYFSELTEIWCDSFRFIVKCRSHKMSIERIFNCLNVTLLGSNQCQHSTVY